MQADKSFIRPELWLDPAVEQDAAVSAFLESLPYGTTAAVIKALLAHVITQSSKAELAAVVGQTILNGKGRRRKAKGQRVRPVTSSRNEGGVQVTDSRPSLKPDAAAVREPQSKVLPAAPEAPGQEVPTSNAKVLLGGITAGTKF